MPSPALADAAAANLATHFTWVQRRVPGMTVRHDAGYVLTDSGLGCDTFNAVCNARLAGDAVGDAIAAALRWFGDAGRPFSWWVCPGDEPADLVDRLRAAGLDFAESELAMALDLAACHDTAPATEGLEIHRVQSRVALNDYAAVLAANWSPPDDNVIDFFNRAAPVLLEPGCPIRAYVGYEDNAPVATAEATIAGGVVGLYNIATLATCRGRGYGSALTRAPLADAAREGIGTAILHAAAAAVSMYERAGFCPFGRVDEYKPR